MSRKIVSVVILMLVAQFGFANTTHVYPNPSKDSAQSQFRPGYCEIELTNYSWHDIHVVGTFTDGANIDFMMFHGGPLHRISLFYYGICHSGMYLTLYDEVGAIYSRYTRVDTRVVVNNYFKGQSNIKLVPNK